MKLKAGDKLICVDDTKQKVLKKGNFYTVKEMDVVGYRSRVWIQEYLRFSFSTSRFQKVVKVEGGICDN